MKYISDIYTAKCYHWLMFLKYNSLGFLNTASLDIPPHKVKQDNSEKAINCYHEINDQIISEFGVEESFLAQKDKEIDIAMLKLEFVVNGNRMKRTMWKIKEMDIQTPEQHNNSQMELSEEIRIVSNNIGVGMINIKDYTVHQYLNSKKATK